MGSLEAELINFDDGCHFWRHCLSCPFPSCLFEIPGGPLRALTRYRDEEIRRRFAAGEPAPQLANAYGMTKRSIYRVLGGVRE